MKLNTFVLPILIGLTFSACSETEPVMPTQADSQSITLSASIAEGSLTDTRVGETHVEEGTYYLSFVNPKKELQTIETLFTDGIGTPWIYNSAEDNDALNWENVTTNGAQATFYLDNVEGSGNSETITLSETYAASEYIEFNTADDENAKNDIVWGSKANVKYNTTPIDFTLYHRMTRVCISIDNAKGETGSKYTVMLSDVKTISTEFNRKTGIVTPANKTGSITLLDNEPLLDEGITPSWILPPQSFGNERPTLTITLEDGTTYKGMLPERMFEKQDLTSSPYPLAFEQGKLLTIYVTLIESVDEKEILFLPAVVENWDDIGQVSIVSRQLGIYDEKDWEEMVTAYNEDFSENNVTLKRFGKYENDKWTIHIFENIGDENDTDFPKLNNSTNINLKFTGGNVYGKEKIEDLIQKGGES